MDCKNTTLRINTSTSGNSCVAADPNVMLAHPNFVVNVKNLTLAIILTIVVLTSIFGNALVVASFVVERRLRHPFNLFILNLAVTDFVVAINGMLFYSINTLLGYWPLGVFMCSVWIYFDWVTTLASVFTIVAISIDRLWAISWPVHYKNNNNNKNKMAVTLQVVIIWICVLLIWTPPFINDRLNLKPMTDGLCIWEPNDNKEFVIVIAVTGHYVPCIIMVFCYCKVSHVMQQRATVVGSISRLPVDSVSAHSICAPPIPSSAFSKSQDQEESIQTRNHYKSENSTITFQINHLNISENSSFKVTSSNNFGKSSTRSREKRIFITLTFVISCYLLCWFPFYVTFDIYAFKPELVSPKLYTVVYWTSYANSTLNPFIYALSNRDFRIAFVKVLQTLSKCKC